MAVSFGAVAGHWAEQSFWRANATGVSPFRVGMSRAEVARIIGDASFPTARAPGTAGGELGPMPGAQGVLLMFIDTRIARIDVTAPGVATDAGVEAGMREERLLEAYRARLTVTPHKYVDGHYLTAAPDATHRIVFETEGGWMTRYRVGRVPEVEWVEACG